jgi:hypothetical protein
MIVFKKVREKIQDDQESEECPHQEAEQACLQSNYSEAIYLFLVGESPALGVDGFQIRNAFKDEHDLARIVGAGFSYSANAKDGLAIIGPIHSGSAASLRAAIEAIGATSPSVPHVGNGPASHPANSLGPIVKDSASSNPKPASPTPKRDIDIAGTTETNLASDLLSGPSVLKYVSFGENWKYEERDLLLSLVCSGYRLNRIAELSEDGTVYGYQGAHSDQGARSNDILRAMARATCPESKLARDDASFTPLVLRFPRNISLLRNAHSGGEQQDGVQGKPLPRPSCTFP